MSEHWAMTYMLGPDGKTPVPAETLEWGIWMQNAKRHVAEDVVGKSRVSTVFLGVDMGFGRQLIFETMVFGGPLDMEQERYATWEEAAAGHQEMLRRVLATH